jgi:DNA repair protein RecN (Recombination protein N)
MLSFIKIQNLALMGETVLSFEKGFTAITGETGAGKSALLGGLKILAGFRAEKSAIHPTADACIAEASIDCSNTLPVHAFLQHNDLPNCEEGILVLRRVIHKTKAPVIQVNGSLVTLQTLRALGALWIDFHEAHESQKLMHESYQLEILDAFSQTSELKKKYTVAYLEWKALTQKVANIKNTEHLNEETVHFIQSQLTKIQSLPLNAEWIQTLEHNFSKLARKQEWAELHSKITDVFEGNSGIIKKLNLLLRYSQNASDMDPITCQPLTQRVQGLLVECTDISCEYDQLLSDEELDPEAVEVLQHNMQVWMELKRKYGPTVEAVLNHQKALAEKIALYVNRESILREAEHQVDVAFKALGPLASALANQRAKRASVLANYIQERLKRLGFKNPEFKIELITEYEFKPHGNTKCRFWFAPNVGQNLLLLNAVASAGEIARVLLALKDVLAELDQTPVLVFDEADANIGGEIGVEAGAMLKRLSYNHQVICVTHLPQVASQADNHFVVEKSIHEQQTAIAIRPIHQNKQERVAELGRMLGDRNSKSALRHAEILLKAIVN